MEQVILEALRLHPPLDIMSRRCTMDYKLPGTLINIKKGEMVLINIAGIHYDAELYPNPEQFNPDNFSKDARAARNP